MFTVMREHGMLPSDLDHILQWAMWVERHRMIRGTNGRFEQDMEHVLRPLDNDLGSLSTWGLSYKEVRHLPSPGIDSEDSSSCVPRMSSEVDEFVAQSKR